MSVMELTYEEKCERVFNEWDKTCRGLCQLKGVVQNTDFITLESAEIDFEQFRSLFNKYTIELWQLYADVATLMSERAGKQFNKVPEYDTNKG